MNSEARAVAGPKPDVCPCCGQPVSRQQLEVIRTRDIKGGRLLSYVSSEEFKERLRGLLHAVDDLRNLQGEERKRHEYTWGAQEEAFRGMEQLAGRIQGRVRAIVEGRGWVAVRGSYPLSHITEGEGEGEGAE